jgi:dUTP pyrophosphatase
MSNGLQIDCIIQPGMTRPTQGTPGAAGYDLYAAQSASILPGRCAMIATGVSLAIPQGFAGLVLPRSGLAFKHGVTVLNAPGLLDSDYRGEIKVLLINHGAQPFRCSTGDRIAQLVIIRHEQVSFNLVDVLPTTERGAGGFGSTGA